MAVIYSLSAWIDPGLFGTKLCIAAGQGVLHALLRPAVCLCSLLITLNVQPEVVQQGMCIPVLAAVAGFTASCLMLVV